MQKTDSNHHQHASGRLRGIIKLVFIQCIVFSLGFIPLSIYLWMLFRFFTMTLWWHWIFVPFIILGGFILGLYSQIILSGCLFHLFNYRYNQGTYPYTYKEPNAFRWILTCSLYTPFRKLMEIFPVGNLRLWYYRCLGMKIGNNTLVGGVIKDPCMTQIGSNTTMGEYAIIYGHIQNFSKGLITIKKICIGDHCVIGAGAIIMPGVHVEDQVTIAAGAVVTQNQVLKQGGIYAGIPAKLIQKNPPKK